jgi:flagellin
MSISIQTNYASLVAQNNLSTNSAFQTQTITRLTSGFRINQSGDDAAGLAVANKYRSSISELTQGVLNANDGMSSLQIADGGLNNITMMLDRLKTLATQSSSTTFTGSRSNINVEYQQLVTDITRQASNIGLNAGGQYNTLNSVYIGGGGNSSANAQVQIDLGGSKNAVDATSLGLNSTSVLGGGTELTGNSTRLDAPGALFLTSTAANGQQDFQFNLVAPNGSATSFTASVKASTNAGLTSDQVVGQLNSQLSQFGISAQVDGNGQLQFGGGTAFTVGATTAEQGTGATNGIVNTGSTLATNNGVYSAGGGTFVPEVGTENLTFQNGSQTAKVALDAVTGLTVGSAIAAINAQTSSLGIYAVANPAGTGISFQSSQNFTVSTDTAGQAFGAAAVVGAQAVAAPTSTSTGNALAAISSINAALTQVGNVQSVVGAGENKLTYAMDLANSQITNFSAAQSRIRDADVASEAANLTKAQVLQQASIAAMAQANQAPQAVLSLLK